MSICEKIKLLKKTHYLFFFFFVIAVFIFLYVTSVLLDIKSFSTLPSNNIYLLGEILITILPFGLLFTILSELHKYFSNFNHNLDSINNETKFAISNLKPTLIGIHTEIPREEVNDLLNVFLSQKSILLTGNAGVGKSGIAVQLAKTTNYFSILIDVRRFSGISKKIQFSEQIGLHGAFEEFLTQIISIRDVLIIVDQLDSVCDTPIGELILELIQLWQSQKNIKIIVISRQGEIEENFLRPLLESDFQKYNCSDLDVAFVTNYLSNIGLKSVSTNLLKICKNILMLEIISQIINSETPNSDINFESDFQVWEKYIEIYLIRESRNTQLSKEFILEGLFTIANLGLSNADRGFLLVDPPTHLQMRFESSGIIHKIDNSPRRRYFEIETFQDHLVARYATNNQFSLPEITSRIHKKYHRIICLAMIDFYERDSPDDLEKFLKEVF